MDLEDKIKSFERKLVDNPEKVDKYKAYKIQKQEGLLDDHEYLNCLENLFEENEQFYTDSSEMSFNDVAWRDLKDVILESQARLKKETKFQYYFSVFEIPAIVIVLIILWIFVLMDFLKIDIQTFSHITIGVIVASIIHSFFILRIHQQSITTIERLLEKRLGSLYLQIAIKNPDKEELMKFGIQMFLGHHVKPSEPFGSKDNPITIGKRSKENES